MCALKLNLVMVLHLDPPNFGYTVAVHQELIARSDHAKYVSVIACPLVQRCIQIIWRVVASAAAFLQLVQVFVIAEFASF